MPVFIRIYPGHLLKRQYLGHVQNKPEAEPIRVEFDAAVSIDCEVTKGMG